MTEVFEVSLIGAKTYGTLKTVFQAGEPRTVTSAEWANLRKEVNPATGAEMFCLIKDLPPTSEPTNPDIAAADLRASGLMGEIDTGAVQNTLSILDEDKNPTLDDDGEELPKWAPDDAPPGEVTMEAPAHPAKRLTIGGKGKTVTV